MSFFIEHNQYPEFFEYPTGIKGLSLEPLKCESSGEKC